MADIMSGVTTALAESQISDVAQANETFGRRLPDGSIPLTLIPGRSCLKPFITIPDGCYAMVQSFGADKDFNGNVDTPLWPPGFHWAAPWTQVAYLVTKQSIVFDTPVKGCKTADNVSVTIDVCLTLRIMGDVEKGEDPKLVRNFVYKLGPRGLAQQLKDAQEEAVRGLARSVMHTEVYGLRSVETHGQATTTVAGERAGDIEEPGGHATNGMKRDLNTQFNKSGVQITDVAITNVRLPKNFADQMQEKTTYVSVIAEQKMKQENQMQLLRHREEIETEEQRVREKQMQHQQEGVKMSADAKKELDTIEADSNRMIKDINEEEKASVLVISTNSNLLIATTDMETKSILKNLDAQMRAEAEELKALKEAYAAQMKAESDLVTSKASAETQRIKAAAEGEAASKLRARREYEMQMRQVRVYSSLSTNKDVVVSGNTGDSLLAEMLVAQRQSQIMLQVNTGGRKG